MKIIKKGIKVLVISLAVVGIFTLTGCGADNKDSKNSNEQAKEQTTISDYSGTYKSEDSSSIIITKDNNTYKADISIYRLATFDDGTVDDIKNDILYISAKDPNNEPIKFTFDYKTKILTVKETTWSLLNVGDTFDFNN